MSIDADTLQARYDYSYTPVGTKVGEVVYMTQAELTSLPEYSTSVPTGVFLGKQWRRREPFSAPLETASWWMGEYAAHPTDERLARQLWFRIEIGIPPAQQRAQAEQRTAGALGVSAAFFASSP